MHQVTFTNILWVVIFYICPLWLKLGEYHFLSLRDNSLANGCCKVGKMSFCLFLFHVFILYHCFWSYVLKKLPRKCGSIQLTLIKGVELVECFLMVVSVLIRIYVRRRIKIFRLNYIFHTYILSIVFIWSLNFKKLYFHPKYFKLCLSLAPIRMQM